MTDPNLPDGCREHDLDPTYAERAARRRDEREYAEMDENDDLPVMPEPDWSNVRLLWCGAYELPYDTTATAKWPRPSTEREYERMDEDDDLPASEDGE